MDSQILVVGPEGGGKTMLLKRLESFISQVSSQSNGEVTFCDPPSTIPTVGVNLTTLRKNKKKYFFRELGGAMAPVWSNYFKDSTHCIYVVDLANRGQVSAATILLLDLLTSRHSSSWPVLIVFNKIDIPCGMNETEIRSFMRLDDIIQNSSQNISVIQTCLHDGRGLSDVVDWLQKTCSQK